MIPKAPVAVTTPRRGPAMGRKLRKARDTASISTMVRTRMMPAAARARSTTASSPTREPVWDMAALAPAALRPVFKAMMGLVRATRAGGGEKLPAPLDAFQVQDNNPGLGIVLQIFQDIHHVHVGGVADVDGLAHPAGKGRGPHLEGPGLGHHGEGRRLRVPGDVDKGRGKAEEGVEDAHGVGAQYPGAVLPGQAHQFGLQFGAPVVGVGKPLADHHQPLNAMRDAVLNRGHHPVPAQGDDRQVGDLRQVGHFGIGLIPQDFRHLGMHQVNAPG